MVLIRYCYRRRIKQNKKNTPNNFFFVKWGLNPELIVIPIATTTVLPNTHTQTHMYTNKQTYYTHVYTHTRVHTLIHTHIHTQTHMYTNKHIYIHVHVCTHTIVYAHTYTQTHKHTCPYLRVCSVDHPYLNIFKYLAHEHSNDRATDNCRHRVNHHECYRYEHPSYSNTESYQNMKDLTETQEIKYIMYYVYQLV